MKKTIFTVFTMLVLVSSNALGNEKPAEKLAVQIQQMLKDNFIKLDNQELTADVRFTINKEGEIVVLSVYTESQYLEGYLKGRLNYRKVEMNQIEEGKVYTVPVRFTA
nr:hypothetical protein [Allomuricauda sp.]